MRIRKTIAPPARLAALFVCVTAMVLAVIGWLGWRLLAQERALDERRLHDQLENTTALAARELDRALSDWETQLPAMTGGQNVSLPEQTIAIVFGDEGVLKRWGVDLPYYPKVRPSVEASTSFFADAESLEFGHRSLASAERIYRRLTHSSDETVRAGALMRLARTLRQQDRIREAIRTYDEMAEIGPLVWVAGAPAEFVARRERVTLFESIGESAHATEEASLLADALWTGPSPIDRVTFDFYRGSVAPPASRATVLSLARGLEALWPDLRRKERGRAAIAIDGLPLVALWRSTPAGSAALLGGVESIAPVLLRLNVPGFNVTLENETGETTWGNVRIAAGRSALRTSHESNLPWALRVRATETADADRLIRSRRLLQVAGFVLMVLVVATAGLVTFRAVGRELSVARLQSEFVATVSHEFRTPLTAMSHLAEMLDEGAASPSRTPQYYRALVKETRRLRELVESLLDFGRMEAGRRTYRLEPSPVDELARAVIDGFADTPGGSRIRLDMPSEADGAITVHADRQALGLALRNLVDNALKYSPDPAPIQVVVRRDNAAARISVADEGPGIPSSEHKEIFRKFIRGSTAASSRASGTGIGLSIADHIVQAHGGRLELESEPGHGSCFTIVLPLHAPESRLEGASWRAS